MKTDVIATTADLPRLGGIGLVCGSDADRIDAIVPWIAAGLERGEAGVWLTAPPLDGDGLRCALEEKIADLDGCLAVGRLEAGDARALGGPSGRFDPTAFARELGEREARARRAGCSGLRIAVDFSWLAPPEQAEFLRAREDEDTSDRPFRTQIHSFPGTTLSPLETLEIAAAYPALLVREDGAWRLTEQPGPERAGPDARGSWWRAAVEGVGDSLMVIDRKNVIRAVNRATGKIFDRPVRELLGRRCYRVIHGTTAPPPFCPLEVLKESGRHEEAEVRLPESGRWIHVAVDPIHDGKGELRGAVHLVRDITRRKSLEATLAANERHYHDMVACSPYAIVIHSGGIIRYVNEATVALVGAEGPDELVGRQVLDFSPLEMREVVMERMVRLLSGETRRLGLLEERILRLDGREVDVEVAAAATTFEGEPAIQVFLHDITERREAARVIRRREQILGAVAFAADHFLRDASWRESIDDVLGRLGAAVGVSRVYVFENHDGPDGDLLTSQRFEWAAPGVEPQIDNPELQDISWRAAELMRWVETLGRGEPICGHVRDFPESERNILGPQGIRSIVVVPVFAAERWWGFIGFDECVRERRWSAPERDALRLAGGILGAAIDREAADRERRELLEWQRGTLDALPDLLFEIDGDGRLHHCHAPDPGRFYLPPEKFLGRTVEEVLPEEAVAPIMESVRRAARTGRDNGTAYSLELDGEVRWFELSIARKGGGDGGGERLIVLARDITDRKRAESVKDDFISTVSHELRTPLSAIHASVVLLPRALDGDFPPERVARLVDIARRNSDRLVRLIDDLLDVQSIEAGKMVLRPGPIDLAGLVRRAVEDNQPYADDFGVRLVLAGETPDVLVRGDESRLMQVMTNLLSNAAKYSPPEGVVEEAVAPRNGDVRVSVRDHGPGIPEAFRGQVFERFRRADSSLCREWGGSGLGLNITRSIVEMHGGRIGFDTRPGEGTTFFFDLPVSDTSGPD